MEHVGAMDHWSGRFRLTNRVLMVHFTPPDVIGGVELVMDHHIQLLQARGFEIEVVAGRPGKTEAPLHVIPELDTALGDGQVIEAELADGIVSERFHTVRGAIEQALRPLIDAADYVIVHNAYTLHFSLPLSAVLWDAGQDQPAGKMIAWCHDLAWTNPLYTSAMHDGFPWSLLRQPAPNTTYVAVTELRRRQLLDLWQGASNEVTVIPNGIDAFAFLRLTPEVREIVDRFQLLDRELVLLLPVRITRRKNIETAIQTVRRLKDHGLDVCFLVSGPQESQHPGLSDHYLSGLKALRAQLGVEQEMVFLAESLGHNLSSETVAQLYDVADVLFFPSSQEGFGLPVLEAGIGRVPIVVSDIPVFHEVAGRDVVFFGLQDSPESIADGILRALDIPSARLYRRVLREFRWESIVDRHIMPLLQLEERPRRSP